MVDFLDEIWERTKGSLSDDDLKRIERAPAAYTPKSAPAKGVMQAVEQNIQQRQPEIEALSERQKLRQAEADAYGTQLQDVMSRVKMAGTNKYETPEVLQSAIDKVNLDIENQKTPQRDMLSEIITSFAPAALGLFGGSTGAIAGAKAAPGIRQSYESRVKEDQEFAKNARERLDKKLERLVKLKQQGVETFNDAQKLEYDKLRTELQGVAAGGKSATEAFEMAGAARAKLAEATAKERLEAAKTAGEFDVKTQKSSAKAKTLSSLNSSDKQRFDNLNMAVKGIREMRDAIAKGENTFSLWGDNDFTAARDRAVEAVGRMQSGGAIGEEEGDRFKRLLPTTFDSAEMQQKKLQAIEDEMSSRFETLGLSAPTTTQAAPNAIKPGTLEGGFIFQGGNPADQKNWKKVK